MIDKAVLFGPRRSLVGVMTSPTSEHEINKTMVLLLNAGMVHRAGPSRLYVKLARRLAEKGHSSVRFDFSGVGDSPVRVDNLPLLEVATREPQEVMNDLAKKGVENFILIGICSGAYCAFKTALQDKRVTSAILINTMDLSGKAEMDSRAWERRYFKTSIFKARAWKNLVTGKVNYKRLFRTLLSRLKLKKKEQKKSDISILSEFDSIVENGQRLLFIFSGKDIARNYLDVLLGDAVNLYEKKEAVKKVLVPEADHLFTRKADQTKMIDEVVEWIVTNS